MSPYNLTNNSLGNEKMCRQYEPSRRRTKAYNILLMNLYYIAYCTWIIMIYEGFTCSHERRMGVIYLKQYYSSNNILNRSGYIWGDYEGVLYNTFSTTCSYLSRDSGHLKIAAGLWILSFTFICTSCNVLLCCKERGCCTYLLHVLSDLNSLYPLL